MQTSERGEEKATRHCWGCLKRRLVCDHTLPHCKKCQKAGKECPGYDEQKPTLLQWVEPGKVTFRRRKKDSQSKIHTNPVPKGGQALEQTDSSSDPTPLSIEEHALLLKPNLQLASTAWRPKKAAQWADLTEDQRDKVLRELMLKHAETAQEAGRLFEFGGRAKIEEIVSKKLHKEAAKMLRSERDPLERLERLLWMMRRQDLPVYDLLSNETSEVVQAVNYYNVRIHPDVTASGELAPNPALILFPLHALHILPPAVHHTLVCMSLNHFIQSLSSDVDRSVVVKNRSKVYHHRGAAIRSLSQYVGNDTTRCSDLTIASILTFMSVELQNPAFADWRTHAIGMQRLVGMRGGFKNLMKEAPHLAPTLVIYVLIIVLGNTCSPSCDQIDLDGTFDKTIDNVREIYNLIFPYTLCPPELFFEMLRTNELRRKTSAAMMLCEMDPEHSLEALDLLGRIEAFVPEDWAQPGTFYDEWLLIGTMYQAAIAIYCTMSLQSLTLLPNTLEMDAMRSIHGDHLLKSLRAAVTSPRIRKFVVWPFVVAGVEAAYRGEATRNYIETSLGDLSRTLGSSCPLKARAVLRRYWQKGVPGWDECFDRAYVFIM